MRKYNLTINDKPFEVVVKEITERDVRVEVNGEKHTVRINQIESLVLPDTVPKAAEVVPVATAAVRAAKQTATAGVDSVIAPMPGQIKAILVREGDTVKAGQKLLIMEAMKLENKIPANKSGIVKQILVRDGDIVSQNQALVIIK